MEKLNSPSDEVLSHAIMEMNEPVIFQHMLKNEQGEYIWKLFEWNISELAEKFGDVKLPFRVGYNARSMGPQWEVNCSTVLMTLSEFIQHIDQHENDKKWYYFDYKYMQEWFKNKLEIINSVNWKRFGIDKTGNDSTVWIGSKGAHTNCHQDSYGCNLVAQIHGRKQWILFPPSSSNFLQPTRVPYEESTIYSKYNFFCPTKEDEANVLKIQDKPKIVTLEPGDVLFVPPGWWHYVESLDFTVSVNIWLPIVRDNVSRVKEAIVKLIVARIGKHICSTSDEANCTLSYCMNLLNITLGQCKNMDNVELPSKRMKHSTWTAKELAAEYPVYVNLLHELETMELEELLKMKMERFSENCIEFLKGNTSETDIDVQNTYSSTQQLSENILNALCHPDVVNKVAELLLQCSV
ncbi:HSPB1-associated protein 1 [Habropoda laboriosa]|uniref:HSPB1-associated protein 1 n=1 Tax=Habropoda laboriosa TaxID=597456 RepID=A0A0L7QM19_9HYME|nr:PREDICTED: HSPB1-associated protein 1 [Habropoda laboriosa]KOC59688.1 HSPB1-associated protein 1 [Habropoda laboriosa]